MGFVGVQSLLFGLVLGGTSLRTEAWEDQGRRLPHTGVPEIVQTPTLILSSLLGVGRFLK
jgi:hypothetical protein